MSECRLYELRLTPGETILARSLTRGTAASEESLLNYIFAWLGAARLDGSSE